MLRQSILAAAIIGAAINANAEEIKLGDLLIEEPVIRATLPNAPVTGGYMIIRNQGTAADKLIAGSASFAGKVEIHEMSVVNEVMKMREVDGGLEIPAGEAVTLEPGGYHIMLMMLKEQMKEGETREVVLNFETGGEVRIPFEVKVVKPGKMKSH